MLEHHCDAGFATDGDADRIGAVDEKGQFVDANKIYSLLLEWLLKRKQWPGGVARAFNTTKMLDRIAARYGRKLYEHGIGFKHVCRTDAGPRTSSSAAKNRAALASAGICRNAMGS